MKLKIGDYVKITKSDVARKGEIGRIVSMGEMTIFGMLYRIQFGEEEGLYSSYDFRKVE